MHGFRRVALSLAGASALAAIFVAANSPASARTGPVAQLAGRISLTSPRPYVAVREHPLAVQPALPRYVVVRPGDTLSVIARRVYGTSSDWPALWWANKTLMPDPNSIEAGEGVQIPASGTVTDEVMAQARDAAAPPPAPAAQAAPPAQPAAPVPAPVPVAPAPPVSGGYGSPPAAFTECVIEAESGGDPTAVNPSSGASGLFGFLPSTWANLGLGYPGGASTAPVSVQYEGFDELYAEAGSSPWSAYDGCAA